MEVYRFVVRETESVAEIPRFAVYAESVSLNASMGMEEVPETLAVGLMLFHEWAFARAAASSVI